MPAILPYTQIVYMYKKVVMSDLLLQSHLTLYETEKKMHYYKN